MNLTKWNYINRVRYLVIKWKEIFGKKKTSPLMRCTDTSDSWLFRVCTSFSVSCVGASGFLRRWNADIWSVGGKTALKFPDRVLALKRHIKLNLDFNREKKTSGQSLERVKACAGTLWWSLTPFNLLPPRTPRCTAGLMQTLSIFIFVSMSMLILNPTKNSGAKMSLCSSSSV